MRTMTSSRTRGSRKSKDGYWYDESAAQRVVDFFERYLRHIKGRWAGCGFELMPWQRDDIIKPLFGWKRPDGTRKYRIAYIEIPRKSGKSTMAAGLALYLLLADGEQGGEVYSAAVDRAQAGIVFEAAKQMLQASPPLREKAQVFKRSITVLGTASKYEELSADAPNKHGLSASGIVFDELHAQPNRELWDVLTTSTGAREQPLVIAITTAGYDRNSICWEQHEYARRVQAGVVDDSSFFSYIAAADEEDDWRDPKIWKKANPGMGTTITKEYLATEAKRAMEIPAYQNTFRRLHLNQWTQQESRALDIAAWDASAGMVIPERLKGQACFAGLDLASTTDIAALVLVFPSDEGYEVLPFFWIPAENMREREARDRVPYSTWARQGFVMPTPGNVIDYAAIRQKINVLGGLYNIREIGHDPWNATQLALELDGDGFKMISVRQGYQSMSPGTKELLRLVMAKKLVHSGNPVLRWMADNLAVKQSPEGNLRPDKDKSMAKIDGIVALIMAIDRATRHQEGGGVWAATW